MGLGTSRVPKGLWQNEGTTTSRVHEKATSKNEASKDLG